MIQEIRVKNFFSIKEEVVLDLQAAKISTKKAKDLQSNLIQLGNVDLLKSAVIYGANASGKSNLIKAIRFCCRLIFESDKHNEDSIFIFSPFKFHATSEPSSFFIRFIEANIEYEYSFELTRNEILKESLYYYPNGRKKKVFVRDESLGKEKKDKYSFGNVIKRPLDVAINTSNKTLYISRASQMDRDLAKKIHHYFRFKFILDYRGFNSSTSQTELLFENHKNFLLDAIRVADSDIIDIQFEKQNVPTKRLGINFDVAGKESVQIEDVHEERFKITTYHKFNPQVPFDFSEESQGTQKLFFMLLGIIDIVQNDKLLMIDEIEDSLHSKIVEFIVDLFHMSSKSQLIFSTHNTNLLNLDRLRRDQIYFVNKTEEGASDLYSLFDYKDFRENMDPEKGYLQGRFDAIPNIDYSKSTLKNIING